jgi:superfamily II DNA or RNA helicase
VATRLRWLVGCDELERLNILDSSAGSGRLIEGLAAHHCTAIEIDGDAVSVLETLKESQALTIYHGNFLDYDVNGFDVSLLNPPFNLDMTHRRIREFGFGCHSQYGEGTKCNSVYAALAHALRGSAVVACIIPNGALDDQSPESQCGRFLALFGSRLHMVLDLPADAFAAEGTLVRTQCGLFLPNDREDRIARGDFNDDYFGCTFRDESIRSLSSHRSGRAQILKRGLPRNLRGLPQNGTGVLRLTRKGRNLVIQPDSLATYHQALDVICGRAGETQYHFYHYGDRPRSFGMDLNAYLLQSDPVAEFNAVVDDLKDARLQVTVDQGMFNWFKKTARQLKWRTAPMRRLAFVDGHQQKMCFLEVHRSTKGFLHSHDPALPLQPGESITLVQETRSRIFLIDSKGRRYPYTRLMAACYLELEGAPSLNAPDYKQARWREVYPGLDYHDPVRFNAFQHHAHSLGITGWLRQFAIKDLIEITARGSGLYNADMGLAKTRFGIAAALLSNVKHSLFCLKSRHVSEWLNEIEKIGMKRSDFNLIDSPQKARALGRFNIITYTRLHQVAVKTRRNRATYADLLRGRIALTVADEAQLLSNPTSKRSIAVQRVNAKRVILMTGTPMRGYGRHVFNLLRLVGGDCSVLNPYGIGHHPYLTAELLHSAYDVRSGTAAFADDFIQTDSASSQFLATLGEGYRRGEKPRIKKVSSFREYMAPMLLRRSKHEPEVQIEVVLPIATENTVTVVPHRDHLLHYYRYSQSFVEWLEEELRDTGKVRDYGTLKHHLSHLQWAASFPQHQQFAGFTAVQQQILSDAVNDVPSIDKAILCFENPAQVEFIAEQLTARGLRVVFIHGGINIEEREAILYDQFRDGPAQWLVSSIEVINEAYNLPQVNHVWFGDSVWEPYIYAQVSARMLRPDQRKECNVRYYIAKGMLPAYRHAFALEKAKAIVEAIDFDCVKEEAIPSLHELIRDVATVFGKAA